MCSESRHMTHWENAPPHFKLMGAFTQAIGDDVQVLIFSPL